MNDQEVIILGQLVKDLDFRVEVLPYLEVAFFQTPETKLVANVILQTSAEYGVTSINPVVVSVEANKQKSFVVSDERLENLLDKISQHEYTGEKTWMVKTTEKYFYERKIYNALHECVSMYDQFTKGQDILISQIPSTMEQALAFGFDSNIGLDYFEDAEKRFDLYNNNEEERIPFDLAFLNKITSGGFVRKTINVFVAGTGGGKSALMCHLASNYLLQGYNVLYITNELAERRIAERIDANILNTPMEFLPTIDKSKFLSRLQFFKQKTAGRLKIKEYPTGKATTLDFEKLLTEYRRKKGWVPDIVLIDYLNICASSRVKLSAGSYYYVKAIIEEIRALMVEQNCVGITATQFNRSGQENSDPNMGNTSESMGIAHTADFYAALIKTENLSKLSQIMVKQLKNRYRDETRDSKFILGFDKERMKFYDVENSAQAIVESVNDAEFTYQESGNSLF